MTDDNGLVCIFRPDATEFTGTDMNIAIFAIRTCRLPNFSLMILPCLLHCVIAEQPKGFVITSRNSLPSGRLPSWL